MAQNFDLDLTEVLQTCAADATATVHDTRSDTHFLAVLILV